MSLAYHLLGPFAVTLEHTGACLSNPAAFQETLGSALRQIKLRFGAATSVFVR